MFSLIYMIAIEEEYYSFDDLCRCLPGDDIYMELKTCFE